MVQVHLTLNGTESSLSARYSPSQVDPDSGMTVGRINGGRSSPGCGIKRKLGRAGGEYGTAQLSRLSQI